MTGDPGFPDGQYLAVTARLALGTGGQTGMFLLRNRLFAEHAGIVPTLVSFDDQPDPAGLRAALLNEGRLTPGTPVRNLFAWLRSENLALRRGPGGIDLVDPEDQVAHHFRTIGALRRWWVTRLFDPDPRRPVFIITDSRFALKHLVPLTQRRRVRLIHVVHNIHVTEPYHWDSPVSPTHQPVLDAIGRLDALVTLTARQRDDIATRFGPADNLYVVPNPIDPQSGPAPETPRRPRHFVMLGRLTAQKRFEDAVQAFAQVAATEPGATLDIYGDGEQWTLMEQQIRHAGLENVVRLRGFDPQAKERLAEATALLLTSRFEGYPLVVLEALRRGCPVIAYDIAYGPREQLTDGENGFLVRPGDLDALAEHIVRLARDHVLATRMSEAARASAADHSVGQYLRDWRAVLQGVQARRRGTAT